MENKSLIQIIAARKEKIQKILDLGINPYPYSFKAKHSTDFIIKKNSGKKTSLAGRIMSLRRMGKASFLNLQDMNGKVQLFISRDDVNSKTYELFKLLDIGDFIGVSGTVFITKTNMATLKIEKLELLTKSIRPIPDVKEKDGEKFNLVSDKEFRYRKRFVDLIINPEVKNDFIKRATIINSIRNFLNKNKYIEVETPVLQPVYGGANAKPFVTYHNALDQQFYLRIATELYLKQLIVGGFEKVYEMSKDFRNEGVDRSHNPEFTMLEFYTAYSNLSETYKFIEKIIKQAAASIGQNQNQVEWDGDLIDLSEFKVISMSDLVKEHNNKFKSEVCRANVEELAIYAESIGIKNPKKLNYGQLLFEIFEETVESKLIQPTFVTEYPVEISPLSRRNDLNPDIADRFELFIGGKEIANGFCELNDAEDQAKRFAEQVEAGKAGDNEAMSFDQDYITALEVGMPPAVGVGIGIDRLAMFLTNQNSIRDVILFPQLKN